MMRLKTMISLASGAIAVAVFGAVGVYGFPTVIEQIERWQTLLTGILALIAAHWATRPVFRQLDEMRRQSAASAVSIFAALADERQEEIDCLRPVTPILRFLANKRATESLETYWAPGGSSWTRSVDHGAEKISKVVARLDFWIARNPQADHQAATRRRLRDNLHRITMAADILGGEFAAVDFSAGGQSQPPRQLTVDDIRPSAELMRELADTTIVVLGQYVREQLAPTVTELWLTVRQLEAQASGNRA